MHIPYKTFGDGSRLPFITLVLAGPRSRVSVEAFVDSGADFSIFHAGWVEHLGLAREPYVRKKIQVGDGDYITADIHPVDVELYGRRFRAPIAFSDQLGPGFNLLGRNGFFNRFRFCFDDKHYILTVTRLR